MSRPRPIFEGELYLVTRRAAGRQFLLRPSRELNSALEYCVAVAAERHGIEVHALVVMSNHWHVVATDPRGVMPAFLRDAHAWMGKVTNRLLKREENLWSSRQTSLVRASGDVDVLERIAYTMENPVTADLVAHGKSWPGLRTCWPTQRRPAKRPDLFAEHGTMPAEATLALHRPPGFEGLSETQLDAFLRETIEIRESAHRAQMQKRCRRALGARAIRKQSPYGTPTTPEPRAQMSPRVAQRDKSRRIKALQQLQNFLDEYRLAFKMWRAGFLDVVFPAGTYGLRIHAAVTCAAVTCAAH